MDQNFHEDTFRSLKSCINALESIQTISDSLCVMECLEDLLYKFANQAVPILQSNKVLKNLVVEVQDASKLEESQKQVETFLT